MDIDIEEVKEEIGGESRNQPGDWEAILMFDDVIRDPLVEVSENLDEGTSDAGGRHVEWDHVIGIRDSLLSSIATTAAAAAATVFVTTV